MAAPRLMTVLYALTLLLVFTGCTSALAGMSPEQLAALAKDKNASVTCFSGVYAGAKINLLFLTADKGIPAGVQIDDGCKASFATTVK